MNSAFSLPALTLAFNVVIISFLASINTNNITIMETKASSNDSIDTSITFWFMVDAMFRGVGQFIFADTTVGGLVIVAGIAIASRPAAMAAFFGSFIACISALYILEVPKSLVSDVRKGLYGYNSAGVYAAIAGNVFFVHNRASIFYGAVGTLLSMLVLVGSKSFLGTSELNLPVMTVPFCITTWLMMYLRAPALIPMDQSNAPARHTVRASMQSEYLDVSIHSYMEDSQHSSSSVYRKA